LTNGSEIKIDFAGTSRDRIDTLARWIGEEKAKSTSPERLSLEALDRRKRMVETWHADIKRLASPGFRDQGFLTTP
jgi:hypothetical protein